MTLSTPNHSPSLEGLSQAELLTKRTELLEKAKGDPSTLSDEEIELMVLIHAQLRKRTSGPPSTAKKKPSVSNVALENLL